MTHYQQEIMNFLNEESESVTSSTHYVVEAGAPLSVALDIDRSASLSGLKSSEVHVRGFSAC